MLKHRGKHSSQFLSILTMINSDQQDPQDDTDNNKHVHIANNILKL